MYDPATQTAKLLDFGIARDAETPAGGAAHARRLLRGHAAVRRPRGALRRAGRRAGRRVQPRHHRLLPADRRAAVPRQVSARAVPAAAHPDAPPAQRGGQGRQVQPGARGRAHGRARARPRQAPGDDQGLLRRASAPRPAPSRKRRRAFSPGSSARTERWTSTRPSCSSSTSAPSATATSSSPPAPAPPTTSTPARPPCPPRGCTSSAGWGWPRSAPAAGHPPSSAG